MSTCVKTIFLRKLGIALQEWAQETAIDADPDLVDMPLLWMIDRNEVRGYPPSMCPPAEASIRLARWARALGLTLHEKAGRSTVTYVGRVDLWPVRLSGTTEIRQS
jgi:hypothetical protein